ncbi:hypothetical protein [Clostridium beijerinckii]|uniref:Uncharacterized protein n=1 Tax=Clostridium beijerinckii TaxID=1520 RepID=A0A1S8SAK2_CLOBE|nr:hypothetical protein [Clostridium beijerinckii]NRY59191.1 hypothetical protein [Clostridium beijerinckii]OOM62491.1 hypothetical protein CLBCK_17580 [Clostridium beijerinckii]
MTFLKQVKLYRVKITEPCDNKNILQKTLNLNYTLNNSGIGYREFNNIIPAGIKGWIIQWMGKKYFAPDDNQEGLKDFLNRVQTADILIPYKRIEGHYCKID